MDREALKKLVIGRQKALESKRNLWEAIWQEVADFVIPVREDIMGTLQAGTKQGSRIYDGTAVGAAQLYADGVHSHSFSRVSPWFSLQLADTKINEMQEVKGWLQDVASRLYTALAMSNFYDSSWMFIYDGGTIGVATMYNEEDKASGKQVFETIHPGEVYIEENYLGIVDTLHRKRKLTAKQAIEKFGEENVPQCTKDMYKQNPFKEEEWVHCVYPREDYDDRSALSSKKRFASVWYHVGSGYIAQESGYDEFPYAVWRFMKSRNSAYARSPAIMALSDIKKANLIAKTMLGAAQASVDSPWNIPSEMMGKLQLKPGGLNPYGPDHNRIISRVNQNINYPIGTDREERVQGFVEKHFKTNYFLMLSQSERAKTATEALEIKGELAAVLGPMVGRLNTEGSDKFIDMVFQAEFKAGRLPKPPDVLLEMGGQPIQIVYLGPLAQAQKRLFMTQGIRSALEVVAPIFSMVPSSMDNINFDETVKDLLAGSGFPAKDMNDDTEVATIRTDRAKQQQAETMKQMMVDGAPAMRDLAEADAKTGGKLSKALVGNAA